jgi:hypothetical protein
MDTVTLSNNGGASFHGPDAVNIFRLAHLISGLKLEMKGLRMSRHISALAVAKQETGLKTNKRELHVARLEIILENAKRGVVYVDERTALEGCKKCGNTLWAADGVSCKKCGAVDHSREGV